MLLPWRALACGLRRSRWPTGLAIALCALAPLPAAQATELRPEVVDAIRRAAEAASAPVLQPPVSLPQAPATARPAPSWVGVARAEGRLRAADLGLVINTADPYSVAVGEHYIRRRGLRPNQVLRVSLPTGPTLTRAEFEHLRGRIDLRFGRRVQALALAWKQPYAVECNSISGALAMGFDAELCADSCKPSRPSRYFNTATSRPYSQLGMRPSMLLAAPSIEAARELIDRGALSDGSLALRGRQPVSVLLLLNPADPARDVRNRLYPPAGAVEGMGVNLRVEPALVLPAGKRLLMVATGAARLDFPGPLDWVPGGLGDHLTSYGGALDPWHGQSTALEWIASGATASHGTVTEPCNHLQKFPHPQLLLLHYLQGSTALEAYWKSVAWPQQALFIGEPLAAPFAVPDSLRQPASAPPAPPAAPPSAPASVPAPAPDTTPKAAVPGAG